MAGRRADIEDLREACVQEALAIIEASGVEALSLREVSRRLGVSHQAPYKHFPSRDHILAELVSRCYVAFAQHLESREPAADPQADLGNMGRAYFDYALTHPLQYRLMFGTPLPDPQQHPEMMRKARRAFSLLRACIGRLHGAPQEAEAGTRADLDALFVWSTVHGFSSIMRSQALAALGLPPELVQGAAERTLQGIGSALIGAAVGDGVGSDNGQD